MLRNLSFLSLVAVAWLAPPAWAEKRNLTPEELRETATHVITGRVNAVYGRTETIRDWKQTDYVAEIRVNAIEKGEGLKKGDLVYARYWHRAWIGKGSPPTGTSGHRGEPSGGESMRVYLARNAYDGFSDENNDGGFNVIGANGFEKLKPSP